MRTPTTEKDWGEDDQAAQSNRPKSLDGFIGQSKAKESLRIEIGASLKTGRMPDHVLLDGPPGLGKTTLAAIVAAELGSAFISTTAPAISKPGDLAAILTGLAPRSVLFIDEIHRLNAKSSELLYTAMEDFYVDLMIGEGSQARAIRLDLPAFTLIGATTSAGTLQKPFHDRFGIAVHVDFYDEDEIRQILERDAASFGVEYGGEAIAALAKRARMTPRIAKKLFRRVRNWSLMKGDGKVDLASVDDCLKAMEIDERGLDAQDRKYVAHLLRLNGRPVGLEAIAAALFEDAATLESVVEPYLMKLNLIQRTRQGRIATDEAFKAYSSASKKGRAA